MAEWIIETSGLTKRYGARQVLRGIDLRVKAGEFLVLQGPNGAGKSTLLRILCTLMRPSSGVARVAGYDIADDPDQVRAKIGLLAHSTYLYDDLTAAENLRFYLRMHGQATSEQQAVDALKMTGLEHVMHNRVRTFSTGMKKRLSIAKLVAHPPRVLFLDEPYSGLDEQGIRMLNRFLLSLKTEGGTVFMVTHHREQGLATGDRVLYLDGGRLCTDSSHSTSSLPLEGHRRQEKPRTGE
jgi:heme exporter protein A